jgi:hypothetical protein
MENVKLVYHGKRQGLSAAVLKANSILANEAFYHKIVSCERFDNSALSPEVLARLLRESDYEIRVRVRWLLPPFGPTRFDRIVISRLECEYNTGRLVKLLIHEAVKAMGDLYNIFEDEKPGREGASQNASFVIGSIAESFIH